MEPRADSPPRTRKLLSIIMPARNEAENLPRAYAEVEAVAAQLPCDYEVIVIDNCSTDTTESLALTFCRQNPRWRYVRFSRNFAVEGSIAAGLRLARGDAVLILFSDLQDPPELIPEFVRRWEEGHDLVYGVLNQRHDDSRWKGWGARLFYHLINRLAGVEIPRNSTDFCLLSRRAVGAINQLSERNRYARGFAHWIGFPRCPLLYDRRPRRAGASKANLFLMLGLAANAITCFSNKPLQMFSIGGAVALLGTLALTVIYFGVFLFGHTVSGLTTIYLLLLGNLAVTLLGIGVLGEYIGRIYLETKQRPLYIIEKTVNLAAESAAERLDQRAA